MNLRPDPDQSYSILSCSGGLDSATLLLHMLAWKDIEPSLAGSEVIAVNFNYGSKQNVYEKACLISLLEYLREQGYRVTLEEVDLSNVIGNFRSSLTREEIDTPEGEYTKENQSIIFVPNRNTIFANILFGKALSLYEDTGAPVRVSLGIHKSSNTANVTYPDCTPEWADALYKCFKIGNPENRVSMYNPYQNNYKLDILRDGLLACDMLGLSPVQVYKRTISCYSPDEQGRSCGKCPTCIERLKIFQACGIKDPIQYHRYLHLEGQ